MEKFQIGEKAFNQKLKGVSTIFGSIITNLIIGNYLIWLYLPEKTDYYFDDRIKFKKLVVYLIITSSNYTKLFFSFYTKYNNIRVYIFFSFLLLILAHSFIYMFHLKSISIISFILYGIGIGLPYHQLTINSYLHFINNKSFILLINKICFNLSPLLYYFFFSNTKTISPNGTEIIIFYFILDIILTLISFDYLRECLSDKTESKEHSLLIKNEFEFSIGDITNKTERTSNVSLSSVNLSKNEKNIFPDNNDNVNDIFRSKKQCIISVLKDNNIYFIILLFGCSMFLTIVKINKISSDDFFLFLIVLIISNVIIYYILEKMNISSGSLKYIPFIVHFLILVFHYYKSKKEKNAKIEIYLFAFSYSIQYSIIEPFLKKIYGEKNSIFFTDFVIKFASSSRLIAFFIDDISFLIKAIIIIIMFISVLFINTNAFDFNYKNKSIGIELKEKNGEDEKNDEKEKKQENEIEDPVSIADVKSDVE